MAQGKDDPNRGLAEILEALRTAEEGAVEGLSSRKKTGVTQSTPPPDGTQAGTSKDAYLLKRLEALEAELSRERERSAEARARLEAREANRGEVEEQIKAVSEALKRERESSHASGRIEALESRLDKMHDPQTLTLLRAIPAQLQALSQGVAKNAQDSQVLAHWLFEAERRLRAIEPGINALAEGAERTQSGLDALAAEFRRLSESVSRQQEEAPRTAELAAECRRLIERVEGVVESRGEAALALETFKAALAALRATHPTEPSGEDPDDEGAP